MALLRVPCFPQLSTKHHHLTAFSSSEIDNKPYSKSSLLSNHHSTNFKLSRYSSFYFQPLSLTHTPTLIRTKETVNFTFRLASTSQEQIQETEQETQEFSRTRLLAQNVPWTSTPEDIRSLFQKHGKVVEVELSMYNKSRNRGLAFVEMASPEDAQAAFNSLESYEYEGRVVNVKFVRPKKERTSPPGERKPITFNLFVKDLLSLALALTLTTSPLPSYAIPSLNSQPPSISLTTPFSQSKTLQVGLENGKIRPCPSINPGCVSTNPKSSSFSFPWVIPADSLDNAIQRLREAILNTQKNVKFQPVEDTLDGQYLQAEVDGGFDRDILEFLVRGDVVAYRCMAAKVTYIYPFTTAFGDSKGQEVRLKEINDQLGWFAPSFDSME